MIARVLVTRPWGTWPALSARFAGTSIELQWAPTTVQVDPEDARPGDAALASLDRCDWLVVTSRRGVEALVRRRGAGGAVWPQRLRVAAVGPATEASLRAAGLNVEIVAAEAGASGLAASLGPKLRAGARVLLVRPEGAAGELAAPLRAAGAEVLEAPLYRTIASDRTGALATAAIGGAFAGVVFTAPSSLTLWLDAAGERREALAAALAKVRRVAIGATTAGALASAGLPADVTAETPTEAAVGEAVLRALAGSTC